jgi:DNA gyrase subunit A
MHGERVVQLLVLPSGGGAAGGSVGLLSSDGRFKRLPIEEFQELSGRATSVLKLKEGVSLRRAVLCREGQDLVVASNTGRLLRLEVNETNLPVMGRNAQGPVLLRMLPGEMVVGAVCLEAMGNLVTARQLGLIQQLPLESLRRCQRGGIGQIRVILGQRGDQPVDLCGADTAVQGALLADGLSLRLNVGSLGTNSETARKPGIYTNTKEQLQQLIPLMS